MTQQIDLHAITFDAQTQVRAAVSEQVVSDYAERMADGVVFPPVVLFHDGTTYYMADGFHRGLAATRNGANDISATIKTGTQTDALWYALGANKTNGHRLTRADKKHAILVALKTWPTRSERDLAEHVGCSKTYVHNLKSQVVSSDHLADRVTGKDGKSYPARLDKSREGVKRRLEQMREMAAKGYTSRQIAAELGVGVEGCRRTLRQEQIEVHADQITKGARQPDPRRIVEGIVMGMENMVADRDLIDFSRLDHAQIPGWVRSLRASTRAVNAFTRRLESVLTTEPAEHGPELMRSDDHGRIGGTSSSRTRARPAVQDTGINRGHPEPAMTTRAERETLIRWDEEEHEATLYTAYEPQARRCSRWGYEVAVYHRDRHGNPTGWEATAEKDAVRFRRVRDGKVIRRKSGPGWPFGGQPHAKSGASELLTAETDA